MSVARGRVGGRRAGGGAGGGEGGGKTHPILQAEVAIEQQK